MEQVRNEFTENNDIMMLLDYIDKSVDFLKRELGIVETYDEVFQDF